MKIFWRSSRLRAAVASVCTVALLGSGIGPSFAQQPYPDAGPAQAPAGPAFNRKQLEQIAAPIALYPDQLLTQVMMAATYPLDVVQAARWRRSHPRLHGPALERALQDRTWDESVKAIAAFPDVLQMMDEKLDWTEMLGEAFLAQEQELLDAVQALRMRAEQAGNLATTSQQRIFHSGNYLVIEPVDPEVVYVPVYEPAVYGAWLYPDYPPYYWYPRRRPSSSVLWFGAAVVVGAALWASWDWNRRRIAVDSNRYSRFNRNAPPITTWQHDPARRRGAPYRAPVLVNRFQAARPGVPPPVAGRGGPSIQPRALPAPNQPAPNVLKNTRPVPGTPRQAPAIVAPPVVRTAPNVVPPAPPRSPQPQFRPAPPRPVVRTAPNVVRPAPPRPPQPQFRPAPPRPVVRQAPPQVSRPVARPPAPVQRAAPPPSRPRAPPPQQKKPN